MESARNLRKVEERSALNNGYKSIIQVINFIIISINKITVLETDKNILSGKIKL